MIVASFVVSCCALIAAGWSYWRSNKNAGRAVAAATRSAGAAERSAEAAEKQLSLARSNAEQYRIPWRLTHAEGDLVRLTNTNLVETAFDVCVTAFDERLGVPYQAPQHEDIGPGSAVEFFGVDVMDEIADNRLVVTWRRTPAGETLEWKHPSP